MGFRCTFLSHTIMWNYVVRADTENWLHSPCGVPWGPLWEGQLSVPRWGQGGRLRAALWSRADQAKGLMLSTPFETVLFLSSTYFSFSYFTLVYSCFLHTADKKSSPSLWDHAKFSRRQAHTKGHGLSCSQNPFVAGGSHTSVRASSQCQQIRQNNMHGKKSVWVPLQQANVAPRTRTERVVRNLHVKGSTSQPSSVAEGREQTMKIRDCHGERSRKVAALHREVGAQEALFKSASGVHFFHQRN